MSVDFFITWRRPINAWLLCTLLASCPTFIFHDCSDLVRMPAFSVPFVQSPVFAIVTGMEHSGTTILSNLIKNAPGALGGFECGMLLAKSPQDFKHVDPFPAWMANPRYQWYVSNGTLDRIYAANSTYDMYNQLRSGSALFQFNPNDYVLDKTPRYIYDLPAVLDRMPGVPCIVMKKSEKQQMQSFRKHNTSAELAEQMYKSAQTSLESALKRFGDRILEVSYDELHAKPDIVMERVFTFLGAEWRSEYFNMTAFRRKLYRVPQIERGRANRIALPFQQIPLSQTGTWRKSLHNASNRVPAPKIQSPVFAIVTGMQHSGTTILSNLIKNAPGALGGFECGMLLAKSPQDFKHVEPFPARMANPRYQWYVTNGTLDRIYAANSTYDMYNQLRSGSALFQFNPNDYVLDRTPRYIYRLPAVLDRMPGVPCIVMQKSERQQMQSFRKHNTSAELAEQMYKRAQTSLDSALKRFGDRILEVSYDELHAEPDTVMERVFTFLGAEWRREYFNMTAFRRKLYRVPQIERGRANRIALPFQQRPLSPTGT